MFLCWQAFLLTHSAVYSTEMLNPETWHAFTRMGGGLGLKVYLHNQPHQPHMHWSSLKVTCSCVTATPDTCHESPAALQALHPGESGTIAFFWRFTPARWGQRSDWTQKICMVPLKCHPSCARGKTVPCTLPWAGLKLFILLIFIPHTVWSTML